MARDAAQTVADTYRDFAVDTGTHLAAAAAHGLRRLWLRSARLETRILRDRIRSITVNRPVFIAGLARAGSTFLLEYLAAHDGVATHRYRDFPFVLTPWWWNWFLDRTPRNAPKAAQRAHRDGIEVGAESPEAMEELVWTAFFETSHDPSVSGVIDETARFPLFESFYQEHIRKLLMVRGGMRYVAKNNYNVTRLRYLKRLFPDCRFIVPVRDPAGHVASMMKQQRLFREGERHHPRARAYLRRAGHFEFGLDRRPVNTGDSAAVRRIIALWQSGDEVRGWAKYWALVHRHIAEIVESSAAVRESAFIVRFEDMCKRPAEVLEKISAHCGLTIQQEARERFVSRVRYPDYYSTEFSPRELAAIREETAGVAVPETGVLRSGDC